MNSLLICYEKIFRIETLNKYIANSLLVENIIHK